MTYMEGSGRGSVFSMSDSWSPARDPQKPPPTKIAPTSLGAKHHNQLAHCECVCSINNLSIYVTCKYVIVGSIKTLTQL